MRSQQDFFKRFGSALILTWLVAGTMDGLAAVIQYLIKGGTHPENIFRYIASAILGKSAMTGGIPVIILGVLLHYLVAFLFTVFFYWIYPFFKPFGNHPVVTGIVYGLIVWAIMNFVVVPLSRINPPAFDLKKALISAAILICCIGLPVALLTRKYYLYKK